MPYKASPNQLEERKIYKLFNEGYTAEEISKHMAIDEDNIRLYDPDNINEAVISEEETVTSEEVQETIVAKAPEKPKPVAKKANPASKKKKKKRARPPLGEHSDKGEVLRV